MPDDPTPDFSDVQGGSSSTAPDAKAPAEQSYTGAPGDNMRKISQKFYGDEMKWKKIWEANKDSIKNPDLIRVGQVLKIPAA